MSKFGKLLFVLTSLAPVLGAYAINDITAGQPWYWIGFWIGSAIGLVVLCCLLLWFVRSKLEKEQMHIASVCTTDKDVLAYLIAYLLPVMAKESVDVRSNALTAVFVFAIVVLVVYHSNAFHFNPLLSLVGYHFYEVETDTKMKYLLITRRTIRKQQFNATVVKVADYMYLDVEKVT